MITAGLNIEGRRLQIAVVRKGLRGITHLHSEEMELPDEQAQRGQALAEAVQKLQKDFGAKSVVFGLAPGKFARFTVELPELKEKDIRNALSFELEKHLPLLPEEYIFDYLRLPSEKGKLNLLVFALKSDSVSWLKEAVNGTGIKIKGIKCGFFELLGEFTRRHAKPEAVFAYCGTGECFIASLRKNAPEWLKTVDLEKAREEIAGAAKGEEVFIAGETGHFTALSYSNVPLEPAFVLAYDKGGPLSMDFMPLGPAGRDLYTYGLYSLAGAAVLLLLLSPVLGFYKEYKAQAEIKREMDSLKATAHELVEIRRELEKINEKREFLLGVRSDMNGPIKALSAMSAALPKDAWLWSFSMDEKGTIETKGFSKTAALLIKPLEGSPVFKDVQFSAPVHVREGWERFTIKMEMEK